MRAILCSFLVRLSQPSPPLVLCLFAASPVPVLASVHPTPLPTLHVHAPVGCSLSMSLFAARLPCVYNNFPVLPPTLPPCRPPPRVRFHTVPPHQQRPSRTLYRFHRLLDPLIRIRPLLRALARACPRAPDHAFECRSVGLHRPCPVRTAIHAPRKARASVFRVAAFSVIRIAISSPATICSFPACISGSRCISSLPSVHTSHSSAGALVAGIAPGIL
jgi:hypothetical protein